MSSEYSREIHLMHLEDQINRMNFVIAEQGRKLDELTEGMAVLVKRLNQLEHGNREGGITPQSGGPSEIPPDGVNR